GLGRVLMRCATGGGAVLLLALIACRPPAPRFTLLFLGRSPAASLGGLSWAPDPEHGRLLAFDGELRVTRRITNPRLATPMAVTPLGGAQLLVTERTGEGVVVDTSGGGRVVRERGLSGREPIALLRAPAQHAGIRHGALDPDARYSGASYRAASRYHPPAG